MSKVKIYCYIDESGRSKSSHSFTIGVLIINGNPSKLKTTVETIEQESGKNKFKWHKSRYVNRLEYIGRIFNHPDFKNSLFYSIYESDIDYHQATIDTIDRVLNHYLVGDEYTLRIFVDALSKTQVRNYSNQLRTRGYQVKQIRGVKKEENDSLIRVADALAGFIADTQEEKGKELRNLLRKNKHVIRV